jgi:predicted HD superfamily hydrolase involved in NAD metabolism
MELEQLESNMKIVLKESRYKHSIGVEDVSCDLALIYGYDTKKASIAGILHDCAKNLTEEQLIEECKRYHIPIKEVEMRCKQLLHAKVGAVYARNLYDVVDEEILRAIHYHCTGKPSMTLLEKIIFTADYIEPYRRPLPRIDQIRKAAYEDLDLAVYMILKNTLDYLLNSGAVIDTLTVETYEYYKESVQNVKKERGLLWTIQS